jgi:hypothetical protein
METNKFSALQSNVQEIIDLIDKKEISEANFKLSVASELLDEILDNCDADEDLIELSRFQVLINQLFLKINN